MPSEPTVAQPLSVSVSGEYFLIACDEVTGRPRVNARTVAVGLGAALLAELVLDGLVAVRPGDGLLWPVDRTWPTFKLDQVNADLYRQVLQEPEPRSVQDWLRYLAPFSFDWVGQRLTAAGVVVREEHRRLLGGAVTGYRPASSNTSGWVATRLCHQLTRGTSLSVHDVAVAGLASVTNVLGQILWDPDTAAAGRDLLQRALTGLSRRRPALYALLLHTEATAGALTLAPR